MKNNPTFAIHQPNYIPWCGYFYKMNKCDVFVYLDTVQYPRGRSFASRNKIKTPNGAAYLTIPVSTPKNREGKFLYTEVKYAEETWFEKHIKILSQNYKRAKFFDEIIALLESAYKPSNSFVDNNIAFLSAIANYLGIKTETVCLSELGYKFGHKTGLIVDIGKKLNARTYLSGDGGGRDYNDESILNQNGINLIYTNFKHPEYKQLWGDFISHLSAVDLLFNYGPESTNIIFNQ